jgi:hypothetical protein
MEYLRGRSLGHHLITRAFYLSYDRANEVASQHAHDDAPTFAPLRLACQGTRRDALVQGTVVEGRKFDR